jgi:hypothetical protein
MACWLFRRERFGHCRQPLPEGIEERARVGIDTVPPMGSMALVFTDIQVIEPNY